MKLNTFKTLLPASALMLSLGMTSCMSDLDKGNIDPNVDPVPNVAGLYSKCYASLIMEGLDGEADFSIDDNGKSTLVRNLFYYNELPTDEAAIWWTDGGLANMSQCTFLASDASLRFLYYRLMANITFNNHYINLDATQSDRSRLAEVRFIRAYHYLLMLDLFGDAPMVTEMSIDAPKQAHAYNEKFNPGQSYTRAELLQLGREYLFHWVENELLTAEADLIDAKPETDTDADYGRVDKAAAWLLLSRLYLNAGTYLNDNGQDNPYWRQAKDYAEKVINSPYSLFDDSKMSATAKAKGYQPYDLLFMGDNGSNGASCEAIFPLKQDGKTTQGWGGTMFFSLSSWPTSGGSLVNGVETKGISADGWAGVRVHRQLMEKFTDKAENFEGKDSKEIRDMGIDDRAIFYGKGDYTIDVYPNTKWGQGYWSPKWSNVYSTYGVDDAAEQKSNPSHSTGSMDTDFFLLRVAEAYLNAAEAEMHLSGEGSSVAKGYLDQLRNRAHAAVKSSYTLNDVLDERAREFYLEGQRRTDLIRFNQFGGEDATYNWEMKGGNPLGSSFSKKLNRYPLPNDEILANSNLVQIDGYNELDK